MGRVVLPGVNSDTKGIRNDAEWDGEERLGGGGII